MSVVLIAGSPGTPSRTAALVAHIESTLQKQGIEAEVFNINDFDANELLFADITAPRVAHYRKAVAQAQAVVLATPVYQASFSGAIKLLLDLVPERGLKGKVVLPLANGGTDSHLLILDYALKPVISALGASNVLSSVYVNSRHVTLDAEKHYSISEEARGRIDRAVDELKELIDADRELASASAFSPGYPAFA
ncbi:NADPH-dependent FMN reductase [Halomonas mongoliensis]|uniref:NADPH-dependent FMN reductase n=1 Tax=Halomonas mongoliensis TaxID=321265 RepID=UPI00403AE352